LTGAFEKWRVVNTPHCSENQGGLALNTSLPTDLDSPNQANAHWERNPVALRPDQWLNWG